MQSAPDRQPSLKARAIAYLARREHSRQELRRKLAAFSDDAAAIESVLDELQHGDWQSDARFAQSYAARNDQRFGARRVLGELQKRGVDAALMDDLGKTLRASETARAQQVWQRKFGALPADRREYARQFRFMAQRGFESDCIRQILDGRLAD